MLAQLMGADDPTVWPAPTTLARTGGDAGSVSLSWVNTGSHPVEIYFDDVLMATKAAGSTTHTELAVAALTVYSVRIRYRLGGNYSPYTVRVPMPTTLPTPGTPGTTVTLRTVEIYWANTTPNAPIEVWRDFNGGGYVLQDTYPEGTSSIFQFDLADGTYTYRLRYNASGATSDYSATTTAEVLASVNPPTTPSANTASDTSIDLAWTLGTAGAATQIFRGLSTNPTTLIHTTEEGATAYTDTGLAPSTQYYYRFKGAKGGLVSASYSAEVEDTTGTPPAGPPTGLSANVTFTDRAALSWVTGDAGATTEIYRGTAPNPTTLLIEKAAGSTSHNDDTVAAGTTYYYRIRHKLNGFYSSYATVTAPVPVNAISGQSMTGVPGDTFVTMSWTLVNGPVGVSFNAGAWDNGEGDSGAEVVGVVSPYQAPIGFTIDVKNVGVTYEVIIAIPLLMKNAGGFTVLIDNSFSVSVYKPIGGGA